jgi:hypothetical protein
MGLVERKMLYHEQIQAIEQGSMGAVVELYDPRARYSPDQSVEGLVEATVPTSGEQQPAEGLALAIPIVGCAAVIGARRHTRPPKLGFVE